jgi:hypothetical protein
MKKETLLELIGEALNGGTIKSSDVPFEVGEAYFFRTVTYHTLGRVKKIVGNFLVLEEASWIADSGRFNEFINDGKVDNQSVEIEHLEVNPVLSLTSVVDAFPWKHKLPSKTK